MFACVNTHLSPFLSFAPPHTRPLLGVENLIHWHRNNSKHISVSLHCRSISRFNWHVITATVQVSLRLLTHFSSSVYIWSCKQISCIIYVKYVIAWVPIVVYAVCKCRNVCQIDVDLVNSVMHTQHIHTQTASNRQYPLNWQHTCTGRKNDLLAFNEALTLAITNTASCRHAFEQQMCDNLYTLIQLSIYTLAIVVLGPVRNVIFLSRRIKGELLIFIEVETGMG